MEKEKEKRNHKILEIPILGPVIGSLIGLLISEVIFGALIGIKLDTWLRGVSLTDIASGTTSAFFMPLFSAIGGIVLLILYKKWFQGEFKGCYNGNWGDKKTVILICIVAAVELGVVINGYIGVGIQAPTLITLASALMAGICEEVSIREIIISLVLRKGVTKKSICTALILSSVMFGLIHATNISAQSLMGTIIQIFVTLGMGVFFGAIYLRTGNLLITILFHSIYDFMGMMQASAKGIITDFGGASAGTILMLGVQFIVFVVCGILIVKGKTEEIEKVWNDRWNLE